MQEYYLIETKNLYMFWSMTTIRRKRPTLKTHHTEHHNPLKNTHTQDRHMLNTSVSTLQDSKCM